MSQQETQGAILCGLNHEALVLARDLGVHVVAAADPRGHDGPWHGLDVHKDDLAAFALRDADGAILAIDDPARRAAAAERLIASGHRLVDLVGSPLGEGTRHDQGLLLQRGCEVSVDGQFGKGVRINVGAIVMHDSRLSDFATLAPGACLLGGVSVGPRTYVGARATLLPGVELGADCVIGAGAVVTRDVPDGLTVKGVPAR